MTLWTDINPGAGSSSPHDLFVFENALYFGAFAPATGDELYRIAADGSLSPVTDINPGAAGSFPGDFELFP